MPIVACLAWGVAVVAPAASAATSTPATSSAATPSPATSTAAAGRAYAEQVLSEAVLPPGSEATSTVAAPQLGTAPQALFLPDADRYEAHAFYVVDLPTSSVLPSVQDHLPRGWAVVLTEPPSGPPPPGETVVQVAVPVAGAHHQDALVTYALVADGGGTEIRVDSQVVWNPARPGDEAAPRSGDVRVTGYSSSSLDSGSSGPVTVLVGGTRAERLRKAFHGLARAAPGDCMENETAYSIGFLPRRASKPTFTASAWTCPTPGTVQVASGGRPMATLEPDCALARAVVAVLPEGRAAFTRQQARLTCRRAVPSAAAASPTHGRAPVEAPLTITLRPSRRLPADDGMLIGTAAPCIGIAMPAGSPHQWTVPVGLRRGSAVVARRTVVDTWDPTRKMRDQPFMFTEPAGDYVVASAASGAVHVVIRPGRATAVTLPDDCF